MAPEKSVEKAEVKTVSHDQEQMVHDALADPDLPHIYANGFVTMRGNADVSLILHTYGRPTGVLHMSYTLAKTLSVKLNKVIADLEKGLGREIATTDEITAADISGRAAQDENEDTDD